MEAQEYYIYKITCLPTGKCYIGQTQKYKYKAGKPYKYGLTGRWCDHVSSSRKSDAPFHLAIREHGADAFKVEFVETVTESSADEREAYWIQQVPQGYNVMKHSRCKHRDVSTIVNLYVEKATSVELKTVHRDGIPRLVYVYITMPDEKKRITFGQSAESSFEDAKEEADAFLRVFTEKGIPVKDDNKRRPFEGQLLRKIRLVPFNKTMVAVYLTTNDNKQTRICFGGKTVMYDVAVEQARTFIRGLQSVVLEDNLSKSQQQVAPCSVEANTE